MKGNHWLGGWDGMLIFILDFGRGERCFLKRQIRSWFLYSGQLGRNRAYEGKSLVGEGGWNVEFNFGFWKGRGAFIIKKEHFSKVLRRDLTKFCSFDKVIFFSRKNNKFIM